ncbi:MAG: hypothetical protein JWQ72_3195 [Polaromonas sp.]|nr:hypothetical protein [Polaromonas sp.]
MNLTALVPLPYRIAALALLAVALMGWGWLKGAQHEQLKYEGILAKAQAQVVRVQGKQAAVTAAVDLKYTPAIERVRTVTKTIVKEIPTYVSANDCPLSPGFRVFHDAAAAGELPDPARIADAAAVPAPALADTIAENYGACRENATRLEGLQEWVDQQQRLH